MKKKILILSVLCLSIILLTLVFLINKKNDYTYEWIDEPESIIGQSRLFVNDKNGKHVDGKVIITYLNNNSEEVSISKDGVLYVKSIIKKVSNPRG